MRTRRIDFQAIRRQLEGRCFICEMLSGNPEFRHHLVYEDDKTVAFLNRYPVLHGYVLVAPKEHREQVTGDFSPDDYLALQSVVHHVAEAVRRVVPTERLYILSLGSQEGNRHVHWHLAPLPPGVPFDQQQLAALDSNVCLDLSDEEMADLAARIRGALENTGVAATEQQLIVADYDPAWPRLFDQIRARVAEALGDLAAGIEHVGSTAVPGLAAKPIIDLDIVVRSRSDLPDVIERLAGLGYEHQGDLGIADREAFKSPVGTPRHHLYVCPSDSEALRSHLRFRDFLRSHPERAARYAELKRRLGREHETDRTAYTIAKGEFVERILAAADAETR